MFSAESKFIVKEGDSIMNIFIRIALSIIFFSLIFYIIPRVIIPDIVESFKELFEKPVKKELKLEYQNLDDKKTIDFYT
jgi:hypothetical protein